MRREVPIEEKAATSGVAHAGEHAMRTSKGAVTVVLAVLACVLGPGTAAAQYYVPLRYDLRYTPNPGYIGPVSVAPPSRVDPYAVGSTQFGNLELTGNIRAGRSFQGTLPYNQQGSQLSARLPSLALSNFKRDSIGLEDLGTGVEYGAAVPYFPGSGSVTSLYTAETRFATPLPGLRAPYGLPNLNSALPGLPTLLPQPVFYMPPTLAPAGAEAYAARPTGLYLPQSAAERAVALIEGGPGALRLPGSLLAAKPEQAEKTEKPGALDLHFGKLPEPYKLEEHRLGLPPEAGQEPAKRAPESPFEAGLKPKVAESFEATQSTLYWLVRESLQRAVEAAEPESAPKPPAVKGGKPAPIEPPGVGEEKERPTGIPDIPGKYEPPASYGDYMTRAEAAMKEGAYATADMLYQVAGTHEKAKSQPMFGRVAALLADQQYLLAMHILDRDLRAHPEWVKQTPDFSKVFPKRDIFDRVVTDLKARLDEAPGNEDLCLTLGFLCYSVGQKTDAKLYLQHVATLRESKPGPEQTLLKAMEPPARAP
jgi:hypothetical protein